MRQRGKKALWQRKEKVYKPKGVEQDFRHEEKYTVQTHIISPLPL